MSGAWSRRRFAHALLVLALAACAGGGAPPEAEVLKGGVAELQAPAAEVTTPGSVSIPFRPPPRSGDRYRAVLEFAGDQALSHASGEQTQSDSQLLEIEYRELPAPGHPELFQVVLEGLHYRVEQMDPAADREVEVAADRLRTLADGEVVLDLQGAQPSGDLTPRKVLDQVFGTVRVDAWGNVVGIQSVGRPVAKRFLAEIPLRETIAYARPALPPEPVAPGAEWLAVRYPPSPVGKLGLRVPVRYTLSGVQQLGGVPCAWVVFTAREEGEAVPSALGFAFDRVSATLRGEAWIELETSRIRLLRIEDEMRLAYRRGTADQGAEVHRLRYVSRLQLEALDGEGAPTERADEWADGTERFGKR